MNNNEIVAISSLESADHAMKKDPGILSVVWSIGRRCNYDCSYCSPFIHDNFSPHIKLEDAVKFLDSLEAHTLSKNKKVKIAITGGEPFVHPKFFNILEKVKNIQNITQISVTTNGSLPLEVYIESSKYITNLTVSLHLEQGDQIVDNTVKKIVELSKVESWFFNVNLMALPKKFDKLKEIMQTFDNNSIKYIVRKIDPPIEFEKKQKPSKKDVQVDNNFTENKQTYKTLLNKNLEINWENYYSQHELDFLNAISPTTWQNMRIYSKDGSYVETNSDDIKIKSSNQFENWNCFIGLDTIYIQDDGSVFRGYCMAGGKIGHISSSINWPSTPVLCPFKYCECIADIITRKAKDLEDLPLIS